MHFLPGRTGCPGWFKYHLFTLSLNRQMEGGSVGGYSWLLRIDRCLCSPLLVIKFWAVWGPAGEESHSHSVHAFLHSFKYFRMEFSSFICFSHPVCLPGWGRGSLIRQKQRICEHNSIPNYARGSQDREIFPCCVGVQLWRTWKVHESSLSGVD